MEQVILASSVDKVYEKSTASRNKYGPLNMLQSTKIWP